MRIRLPLYFVRKNLLFSRCCNVLVYSHLNYHPCFLKADPLETTSKTEINGGAADEKILCELYDMVARGFKLAEEYKWKWIVPIWILLLTFIFMPVFSEDGIYVLLPLFSQFSGEVVFFIQLVCVVLSVSYFWSLVILKRMEKNAYLNAMNEIKLKLATIQRNK